MLHVSDPCNQVMARLRGQRLSGAMYVICARSRSVWLVVNFSRTLSIEEADGSRLEQFSSLRMYI